MNLQTAINLAEFVQDAEGGGETATAASYSPPGGYTVVDVIYANDLVTDLDKANALPTKFVSFGYIAQSPAGTDFVVAIRGTDSIWEWIQDARFGKTPFLAVPGAGQTEDGFTDMYGTFVVGAAGGGAGVAQTLSLRLATQPSPTLKIAGHSLGAALATLLGFEMAHIGPVAPDVYTYASPYVGDPTFASAYNGLVPNTYRIANVVDLITHVPPAFLLFLREYEHVGEVNVVNSAGKVKIDPFCFHHLRTYQHLLTLEAVGMVPPVAVVPLDTECNPVLIV